jgi:hypothetical protein
VLTGAVASASWAFAAMVGTAALGLHLLGADAGGSLGPMTAAVVAAAVGGKVQPSGDVGAFGLSASQAQGAFGITPLGVSLAGALFMAWVFLRSVRAAGPDVAPAEAAARVAVAAAVFTAMAGGLAWAGQDTVAVRGAAHLPLGDVPGLGGIGGGLADGLQGIAHVKATVRFHVETGRTLLAAAVWALGVLLLALAASRRSPLRPAVSAVVLVMLVAVAAGWAAAAYAALTGEQPGRIMGAALLGAPNGAWLAVPLGLFVPWKGTVSGPPAALLPDPVDRFLAGHGGRTITPGGLAALDGRVWLLPVATGCLMLLAAVVAATRTRASVGACAVRLGLVTALALPLLVVLTSVRVNVGVSVFGFDATGGGVDLHGSVPLAFLLGAGWGAVAGAAGAVLARLAGAVPAAVRAPAEGAPPGQGPPGSAPPEQGARGSGGERTYPEVAYRPGPYRPSPVHQPFPEQPNPYRAPLDGAPPPVSDAPTIASPARPPAAGRRRPADPQQWPDPPPPPPPPGAR